MLKETADPLGGSSASPSLLQSRSLRLTRYADPTLEKDYRKAYLEAVVQANSQRFNSGLDSWKRWFQKTVPTDGVVYARLEARLLVNIAGTVLENAGLQLDRFGTVYIPGSAIKGCVRRTALAALRQWSIDGSVPSSELLASIVVPFSKPADLLLAIIHVFGCSDSEWNDYKHEDDKGNDLAWACAEQWPQLRNTVRDSLKKLGKFNSEDIKPHLSGSIAFLPAYPYSRPSYDLELDVLTPHHKEYYEEKLDVALDNEDPVPVYFPSVAKDAVYAFGILPLNGADASLLSFARICLLTGLEIFGLGAKTNAGYGWFRDVTESVQNKIKDDTERTRHIEQEKKDDHKRKVKLADRKKREKERAAMTPDQRADTDLADIANDWSRLKSHLTSFDQLEGPEQAALIRWFTNNENGRALWLEQIKPMRGNARDRKLWKRIQPKIYAARKQLKLPSLP